MKRPTLALLVPLAFCCMAPNGNGCITTIEPIGSPDAAPCPTCDAGNAADDGSIADASGADASALDSGPDAVAAQGAADGGALDGASSARCLEAGAYTGIFAGEYTPRLTTPGIPVPIAGDVALTLAAGAPGTTCTVDGVAEDCASVLTLQGSTVTGTMDGVSLNGAVVGGFPFFCSMTGLLACDGTALVGGWIECTYCLESLTTAKTACAPLDGGASGVAGGFAGPLTAGYDVATLAFTMGTWNGAEALAGNDGGSPGPNGGPPSSYLSDSGVYTTNGNSGGSGTWNASHQ